MAGPERDPWLLTPGPLTTSATVKAAMTRDWGSRDAGFIAINRRVRERLVQLVGGGGTYICVPVQGSGTFAVEAMIGSFLPKAGKLLILINGAYGKRAARICDYMGRTHVDLEWAEDQAVDPRRVEAALKGDAAITHVFVVHCETTSGVLNPIVEVGKVVAAAGRRLLIDSMSAFGALPLDAAKGNAHSLSLDLHDQWTAMEKTAQWRFTPPIQVIVAFEQALREHEAEGGVAGRGARYRDNCRILVEGMRALGFETLLPDALQAPIIVTFGMPADPRFQFEAFYDRLREKGYVIYPGKLTVADSFRIGCIGRLGEAEMNGALAAVKAVMAEMGVKSGAPATLKRTA